MGEHYTRNTLEAEAFCKKCRKRTMHRVDGVKLGPCLVCIARLDGRTVAAPTSGKAVSLPIACSCSAIALHHLHSYFDAERAARLFNQQSEAAKRGEKATPYYWHPSR